MTTFTLRTATATASLVLAITGCHHDAPSQGTGNIIDGEDASAATYDAIGTIGTWNKGEDYQFYCTATLIAPHAVITAKHCAVNAYDPSSHLIEKERVYFALGADATEPTRVVEAASVLLSPVADGGLLGLGSDVAIYMLTEAIEEVEPAKVRLEPFTADDVGSEVLAVGFGVQDADMTAGTRHKGVLEVIAIEGQPLHAMYGTLNVFLDYVAQDADTAFVDDHLDSLAAFYDTTLLPEYELWVHGRAQPCHGDSGGPLLVGSEDAAPAIGAVVSGGMSGVSKPCIAGEAYATFGPENLPMIETAIADPCAGLPEEGRCLGNTAVRCSSPEEGERHMVVTDCTELPTIGGFAQRCRTTEGVAACGALF